MVRRREQRTNRRRNVNNFESYKKYYRKKVDFSKVISARTEGGMHDSEMREKERNMLTMNDDAPIIASSSGGTFCDRFLSTLKRTIQQKRRDLLGTILEMLVPLFFVVGTIILWAAFGNDFYKEMSELSYKTASSAVVPTYYQTMVCNNASMGLIDGLSDCASVFFTVNCSGDESTLPVHGLCYDSSITGSGVVGTFLNSLTGPAVTSLPLDTIIIHQWMARKTLLNTSANAASSTLTTSGLAANTRMDAILCSGNIYFTPANKIPKGLLEYFGTHSLYFKYVNGGIYNNFDNVSEYVKSGKTLNWAIIEINEFSMHNFNVTIHMNSSALPSMTSIIDIRYPGGFQYDRGEMYIASGFSSLQKLLYDFYAETFYPQVNINNVHPYLVSFGYVKYSSNKLLDTAASLVAFILVLSFLYPVSQLSKKIVLEKELRIREAVLIMGMSNTALYLAWFVTYALQYFIDCIIITILLKFTYVQNSDAYIILGTFFMFALTSIPLSGIIASFFSKARLASMLSPLIFFAMSCPIFAFSAASSSAVVGASILSPTAFAQILSNILTIETGDGFTSDDWLSKYLEPKPSTVMIMLCLEFVIYYLLMFYLDAVMPKDWGTAKNPFFFILEPYHALFKHQETNKNALNHETNLSDGRSENGVFEDISVTNAAVNVCGLRKEFKRHGKKFVAVNNLFWQMRDKEISVLLGHNGAGKSTAMNMMTGMLEADAGDCYIYDKSVRRELSKVRQMIGFCPQHNILWPELTCREHLEYFGKIKGLRGKELEESIWLMLKEVDLIDKIDAPSHSLSGGQKRKLSIAIAFVGRSPLVFLDEPTAGLDVGARRYIWELLKRMSESHTIFLTTHYMDEADLLGHRIGIMSQGRLSCSGSSIFLKSRLGVGYHLNVSVAPDADAESIDKLILSLIHSAEASSYNGSEIIYKLPMADIELFPHLLSGLETEAENAGIRGYSLSATTLEEVFLQIAIEDMYHHTLNANSKETIGEKQAQIKDLSNNKSIWECQFIESSSSKMLSQFKVMMFKRFWNALRDRRMQCFQIACPVVCILLAMFFTLVKFTYSGSVTLSAGMFKDFTEMEVSNCESHFNIMKGSALENTIIYDRNFLSGLNMSWYTIDTFKNHSHPRYTSIFCNDPNLQALVPEEREATFLFYNTSAYHSSGLALSQLYQAIIKSADNVSNRTFITSTSPMPQTESDIQMQSGVQTILIGAIVMIPFTFLPSNPVAWIVKEKECKARHLQDISGLHFYIYWLSNFIFDISAYLLTMFLVMIIFLCFRREEYVSENSFGPTLIIFLTYGFCSTAMAYALSFIFSEHSSAQTITMAMSFVTGFMLVMMVFILSLVDATKDASQKLRWPFRLVPSYCVGEGIINLAMNYQKELLHQGESSWSLNVIGWPCIYMTIEFPMFVIFTLMFDHPIFKKLGQRRMYHRTASAEIIQDEDSDVEDEREAVYEQEDKNYNEDIVRVVDLRKEYLNGKVAVRNLTFSILPDEVFGFLGTNGAGKTTTISILCQEFMPSSGCAYICGYDVVKDSVEALQCIGYCPQFDATLDLLTVEEHLYLYAGIRGIVSFQRADVVSGLMTICDIIEYRNIVASKLSGGNRRKLSVAIALIGSPQVIFLDEPSAGMDPVARRGLWTTIQTVARFCSIVLTTHHLEEVEALADTVAIMANGALRCIGDKIHLKNKYGSGFEMSIRIAHKEQRFELYEFIHSVIPSAILNEYKGQRFIYALPQEIRLSEAFQVLQTNKERFLITDYSISQTSIEQVFLRISEHEELLLSLGLDKESTLFAESHARLHHYNGNTTLRRRCERETKECEKTEHEEVLKANQIALNTHKKALFKESESKVYNESNNEMFMSSNPLAADMNQTGRQNVSKHLQFNTNKEINHNQMDNAAVKNNLYSSQKGDNYYEKDVANSNYTYNFNDGNNIYDNINSNDNNYYYNSNYNASNNNNVYEMYKREDVMYDQSNVYMQDDTYQNFANKFGNTANYNDYYSQFSNQNANNFYDNHNNKSTFNPEFSYY